MISRYTVKPVFRYVYKPLDQNRCDGGFSATIYEDNTLGFCVYDIRGFLIEEYLFGLPYDVLQTYNDLLIANRWFLVQRSRLLTAKSSNSFACVFCFDGYEPIYVTGLYELMQGVRGEYDGVYTQLVYALFGQVSNVLIGCGIYLCIDRFLWFDNVVVLQHIKYCLP